MTVNKQVGNLAAALSNKAETNKGLHTIGFACPAFTSFSCLWPDEDHDPSKLHGNSQFT